MIFAVSQTEILDPEHFAKVHGESEGIMAFELCAGKCSICCTVSGMERAELVPSL